MDFFDTLPPSIKEAMAQFKSEYTGSVSSPSHSINRGVEAIHESSGKHLRPLLLLLVAGCFGTVDHRVINGAVFIELLHTATLIHDDVMDKSMVRRGKPSVNARMGNQKAVLFGDYILTTAMMKAVETENMQVVHLLTLLGKQLSEGEFLQMDAAESEEVTDEEDYYAIIGRKTASLMATSVEVGAILSGVSDNDKLHGLRRAGFKLGKAFQIKDDIFDYIANDNAIGKPTGNDLREHKITLPLIYALNNPLADSSQTAEMKGLLAKSELREEEINRLIAFAIKYDGVTYARQKMQTLIDESKALFIEHLPQEAEWLDTILALCDFVGDRAK